MSNQNAPLFRERERYRLRTRFLILKAGNTNGIAQEEHHSVTPRKTNYSRN